MTNPLADKKNWTNPKTWVIPLAITVMVDDATKYDASMKTQVDRIVNELRGICANFDKTGKQLIIKGGEPIKNIEENKLDQLMAVGLQSQIDASGIEKVLARLDALENLLRNGK